MSLPTHTKALTVTAASTPASLSVLTVPIPPPAPGTTTVQVLAATIGPHSLYALTGTQPFPAFPLPFVPGHSAICRILAPAPDAVSQRAGDLVLVESFVRARDDPAGVQILMGLHSGYTDGHRKLMDEVWRDGLWKGVASVPVENCHRIDEARVKELGYSFEELTVLNRSCVAMGGMGAVDLKAGQTIIVGPSTGQFSGAAVEIASAMGANVIALGRNQAILAKLALLPRVTTVTLTGDVTGDATAIRSLLPPSSPGADAFVELSSNADKARTHIASAIMSLRPGARVALMGGVAGDLVLSYPSIMYRNITLRGQYMYSRDEVALVLRMVENGVLKMGKAAGHEVVGVYGLDDWEAALKAANENAAYGQAVVFAPTQ